VITRTGKRMRNILIHVHAFPDGEIDRSDDSKRLLIAIKRRFVQERLPMRFLKDSVRIGKAGGKLSVFSDTLQ